MPDANAIFISYRRIDSNDVSGRIYDRLVATFGAATVFKDVHSIPYGVDFPTYIRQQLGRCKVLLAVIGPTWLTVERQGQRRLDDPADWVRIEIQTALENEGITVIPVLVGGGDRLSEANLPDGLRPLAKLNSAQARPDPDFHIDMTRLVRRLEEIVGPGNSVETTPKELTVAAANAPVSVNERLKLIQTLNGLPMTQFEELAIALNPPPGILPPNLAAQGNRAPALLQWVEGPTGPGIPQLQVVLNLILNQGQFQASLNVTVNNKPPSPQSSERVRESERLVWQLTGEQRKQWRAAFISAFPRQPDLELMLEDELDESLNQITQGQPNYELAVRDLLRWAEAQGKLKDLLAGALRANPGNPKLQELASQWLKP
jgi:hypothetical protein